MRNLNHQYYVFISVLVMVVHSASVHNCTTKLTNHQRLRLGEIRKFAENLTHLSCDAKVPDIYGNRCECKFFCKAEEALKNITCKAFKKSPEVIKHLKDTIKQYNNQAGGHNCPVNGFKKTTLSTFLQNVKTCASQALNYTR